MSVIMSLMYAAGAVALLAVVLECCCRRRLSELRDQPHIAALNGVNMNAAPYPVGAPYPVLAPYPVQGPVVSGDGTVVYPGPQVAQGAGQCPDQQDCFFRSYAIPAPPPSQVVAETPPPSYEQVMANHFNDANKTLPA